MLQRTDQHCRTTMSLTLLNLRNKQFPKCFTACSVMALLIPNSVLNPALDQDVVVFTRSTTRPLPGEPPHVKIRVEFVSKGLFVTCRGGQTGSFSIPPSFGWGKHGGSRNPFALNASQRIEQNVSDFLCREDAGDRSSLAELILLVILMPPIVINSSQCAKIEAS